MIIIICRPSIGQNDRLQVVAARGSSSFQVTPLLPFEASSTTSPWSTRTAVAYATPRGLWLPLQSCADHERSHCCNILLNPAARSWLRTLLEVVEMYKGEGWEQARNNISLKMQRPCRPGGTQQSNSEKGELSHPLNPKLQSKLCPGAQSEVHPQCVHRAAKTEHGCPNNPFIRCHSYRQLLWGEFWDLYVFLIGDQGVGQPVAVLHTTPNTSFKASGTVKATLKTFKANSYSPKATPKTSISFHKYSQSRSNSVNQQIWANMFKTS